MFFLLTVVTGIVYPLLVTVVAQVAFPHQANGSLIVQNDKLVGSELLGQSFDDPKYFWGRPRRLGVSQRRIGFDRQQLRADQSGTARSGERLGWKQSTKHNPTKPRPVPVELVTASASGLDPHISPAAAEYQVQRVAAARASAWSKFAIL